MVDDLKRVRAVFYRTSSGSEPVREWLLSLPPDDRRTIGIDIKTVEYGWPIGMPVCRPLVRGVWEVRSDLASSRIARVLFCLRASEMYLLHGFIKKTQRTPRSDPDFALRRRQEVMQ